LGCAAKSSQRRETPALENYPAMYQPYSTKEAWGRLKHSLLRTGLVSRFLSGKNQDLPPHFTLCVYG
jgi:hypothetical protein